jgi:alkanesulfonate monooxygenase SsuD/methylene tetrahydromethanopterin reductase-like flavin-dependent oxidoreductase (luciferase family)
MRIFHFSEQPYPAAWLPDASLRVTLPNSHCDPVTAAGLYHRYYDEWLLADELGFDIMTNEHHSTTTCLSASISIVLSILARNTRKARLLALGVPLPHRPDPLRVAEEMSMIDVISHGRLELGFVKGVPYEVSASNVNPARLMDRFWEAHDLIIKAMSTTTGPFNFEGEFFTYRNVNIWPRPYQQPHPPIWSTTSSVRNIGAIARHGYKAATFLGGFRNTRILFDAYRRVWSDLGRGPVPPDRFGYLALCALASNETEAMRRAEKVAGYLRTTGQVAEPFRNPPGFASVEDNVAAMRSAGKDARAVVGRSGRMITFATASVEELIDAGLMFAGTPDQVFEQIADFNDRVGGFGNLLAMMQAGHLTHDETVDSLTLFAKEVMPRLSNLVLRTEIADAVAVL